jgi:spermidine synthase
MLCVSVGLPYFVISATAPLLQSWFGKTHPGQSPFRLYALSNAGSLLGLLTYPTLVETSFSRVTQALLWGGGLVLYGMGCAVVGFAVWRTKPANESQRSPITQNENSTQTTWLTRVLWLLLPACASLLLLAITNKICQDVAVIPFLWILPLAAYLLSFIICFDSPKWYSRPIFGCALMLSVGLMAWAMADKVAFSAPTQILMFTAGLFVCCMVCHGEVYRLKPESAHLTSFYLLIAAGGALGGVFVALIAPTIFPDYFELHLGIILCAGLFLFVCARHWRRGKPHAIPALAWGLSVAAVIGIGAVLWRHEHKYDNVRVYRSRNFYGVLNVLRHEYQDPTLSLSEMMHGRVAHGMQFLHANRTMWPTLYYTENSGIGRALSAIPESSRRIGFVGLGAGTMAAYGKARDTIRYYEINPDVERAARAQFSFLSNSAANVQVVLGDARLSLESEPPQDFDLLALDAFNSDSIPVHLLTREAFKVYQKHLKTNGIIAVHVSNMSLNLEPVVCEAARASGYNTLVVQHFPENQQWWVLPSTWVVLSRDCNLKTEPAFREAGREPVNSSGKSPVWTDDFAALFPLFRWHEFLPWLAELPAKCTRLGVEREQMGDIPGAIEKYREALRHDPILTTALNNLAWLLATTADPKLRNGGEAVRAAETACAITQYKHTRLVGTLAAAYAEAGRFEEAVTTGQKACELASASNEAGLTERNRQLLDLYKRRQPYHDRR